MLSGRREGYAYSRWGSVTSTALESAISTLVGGGRTMVTASGMAANFAALQAAGLKSGATLLASREIYGNTYDIIKGHFSNCGAECVFADFGDLDGLEKVMKILRPQVVFFEVLTNPALTVLDAPRIISLSHSLGAKVVVDNTFATPYLCRPFMEGADYEVHSLTKYINGHGDVLGGSVTCAEKDFNALESIICTQGNVLSPDCARLIQRGLATFPLRMEKHCENALAIARYLVARPEISRVRYPGLETDPHHAAAAQLFAPRRYGGMLCFDLKEETKDAAFAFMDSLSLITPSGSLGDVKSLIIHPSSTTHKSLSPEEKLKLGIRSSTLRLSAGIENKEDIIRDLEKGFEKLACRGGESR
jgi:cystathionine gamma-synthase/methionine-gamma-lyase